MDKTLKSYPAKAFWSRSVLGTGRGSQSLGCFIQVCSLSLSVRGTRDGFGVNCLLGHPLLRGCSTAPPAGRAFLSVSEDISVGVCSLPCWEATGLERCWLLIKKLWRRNASAAAPSNWLWLLVDCSRICDSVKSYILEGLKIIRVFNHGLGMSGLYLCVSPSEGHLGKALR